MSQIALPLAWPSGPGDDAFIVTPCNAQAVHALEHWGTWPVMAAILTGPRKSGRSLLARIFAAKSGGAIIDDAERYDEEKLFHAWNHAQSLRRPLLFIADAAPPVWPVRLPDLQSRLSATPVIVISAPDETMTSALFARSFHRRGLDARPDLVAWLTRQTERSYVAIERTVDLLDQQVLESRKRLSIPAVKTMLMGAGLLQAA